MVGGEGVLDPALVNTSSIGERWLGRGLPAGVWFAMGSRLVGELGARLPEDPFLACDLCRLED